MLGVPAGGHSLSFCYFLFLLQGFFRALREVKLLAADMSLEDTAGMFRYPPPPVSALH